MDPQSEHVPLEYWVKWTGLRLCGVVVFTDRARHDGSSPDGPQIGEAGRVPARQRFKVWRSLAPGLVRSRSVVVDQVLTECQCQNRVVMVRMSSVLNASPNAAV